MSYDGLVTDFSVSVINRLRLVQEGAGILTKDVEENRYRAKVHDGEWRCTSAMSATALCSSESGRVK